MRIEVDQSGKIEDTAKDTILCLSNDVWCAVKITAAVKRQLQERFRRHGQIRNFVLFTFGCGLFELLRLAKPLSKVVIDREYTGKEPMIKNILTQLFSSTTMPTIEFLLIGKNSSAHLIAKEVAEGKKQATLILTETRILKVLKKTEVGKRLKNA